MPPLARLLTRVDIHFVGGVFDAHLGQHRDEFTVGRGQSDFRALFCHIYIYEGTYSFFASCRLAQNARNLRVSSSAMRNKHGSGQKPCKKTLAHAIALCGPAFSALAIFSSFWVNPGSPGFSIKGTTMAGAVNLML